MWIGPSPARSASRTRASTPAAHSLHRSPTRRHCMALTGSSTSSTRTLRHRVRQGSGRCSSRSFSVAATVAPSPTPSCPPGRPTSDCSRSLMHSSSTSGRSRMHGRPSRLISRRPRRSSCRAVQRGGQERILEEADTKVQAQARNRDYYRLIGY